MPAPSPIAVAPAYRRHRPEQTALYAIVAEHYPRFVQEIERSGSGGQLPQFVRRGFCPSCGARRMAESAAHLVDHVFAEQPVRQYVLTFPFPLRFLLAAQPEALTAVLAVVQSTHVILEPLDFMARLAARADRHTGKASCAARNA